jgi:hypothetical protein
MDLSILWSYMRMMATRLQLLREQEQGAVTLEQILVAAILAASAIAVGTIVYNLALNKANSIKTTTIGS